MSCNLRLSVLALSVFATAATAARANTIGPSGCTNSSCNGDSYTLSYSPAGGNTVDVFLTIDGTGFNAGTPAYLHAVALKLTDKASNVVSVNLVSPPTPAVFTSTVGTGLNNASAGCGGGSNGYFCSQSSNTTGVAVGAAGDVYTFEWALTLNSLANLNTTSQGAEVKALYVDGNGIKVGAITSEPITLDPTATPEPSSLMLLGSGVLGLAGILRRRIE